MKQIGQRLHAQRVCCVVDRALGFRWRDLEATKWFKRPVEIVDSQVPTDAKSGDLVRFSIKATYYDPDAPPPAAPAKGAKKR